MHCRWMLCNKPKFTMRCKKVVSILPTVMNYIGNNIHGETVAFSRKRRLFDRSTRLDSRHVQLDEHLHSLYAIKRNCTRTASSNMSEWCVNEILGTSETGCNALRSFATNSSRQVCRFLPPDVARESPGMYATEDFILITRFTKLVCTQFCTHASAIENKTNQDNGLS